MNDDPSFFALVVRLQVLENSRVPATQGDLTYAAFLALVQAVQPDLAKRLHDVHGRKPFSLSPLWGLPPAQNSVHLLRAGHEARLRLGLLSPDLFNAFTQSLLGGQRPTLRLGQASFLIKEVVSTPGSDLWAGYASVQSLIQTASQEESHVHFLFASPTAYGVGRADSGKGRRETLPIPRYVWASLRGSWLRFTEHEIPAEFEDWVERNVVTSRVNRWQTSVFRFRKSLQVGGHGDVIFEALDDDPQMLSWWNLLADFAFYSGVGYKTSMGMGTVRRAQ